MASVAVILQRPAKADEHFHKANEQKTKAF
jgi:hypothetical protein